VSASGVRKRIEKNEARMGGHLASASQWTSCTVCGIHGAARARRGIKKGTNAARRRHERELVQAGLQEPIEAEPGEMGEGGEGSEGDT
jgi:hypothetical protein